MVGLIYAFDEAVMNGFVAPTVIWAETLLLLGSGLAIFATVKRDACLPLTIYFVFELLVIFMFMLVSMVAMPDSADAVLTMMFFELAAVEVAGVPCHVHSLYSYIRIYILWARKL